MLNKNDIKILEEIVELEGKCMKSTRCKVCPFRAMCLPEFINPVPPTESRRCQMALNILTHHALMQEDLIDITEFSWKKSQ
jgi:hypothetical protein